jgi:hypothetical protein
MTAKIFQQNAGGAQIAHQQPVKTGQNSLKAIGKFRDKLVHGVPLPSYR